MVPPSRNRTDAARQAGPGSRCRVFNRLMIARVPARSWTLTSHCQRCDVGHEVTSAGTCPHALSGARGYPPSVAMPRRARAAAGAVRCARARAAHDDIMATRRARAKPLPLLALLLPLLLLLGAPSSPALAHEAGHTADHLRPNVSVVGQNNATVEPGLPAGPATTHWPTSAGGINQVLVLLPAAQNHTMCRPAWPVVPPELDLISADRHKRAFSGEVEAEATNDIVFLLPKLPAHQQAVFVPKHCPETLRLTTSRNFSQLPTMLPFKADDATAFSPNSSRHTPRRAQEDTVEAFCTMVAGRDVECSRLQGLCPIQCPVAHENETQPSTPSTITDYSANCAVLLELQGGCAHDLSVHDPVVPLGTSVSDVCPDECSGHGGCEVTAADIGFLGRAEDSSGRSCSVRLDGDACVDAGGMLLSGQGKAMVEVGDAYASNGAFTLSFWLLKSTTDVWMPSQDESQYRSSREVIYAHPSADIRDTHPQIEIFVTRSEWQDHWTLGVSLRDGGLQLFDVSLHRDEVPQWKNLMIVANQGSVACFSDGTALVGRAHHTSGNLIRGLDRGPCVSDGCEIWGTCEWGSAFQDGPRRCGAASMSTTAWGGEPNAAIDEFAEPAFDRNGHKCTHTDSVGSGLEHPIWWQVDLGSEANISSVEILHRSSYGQERVKGAFVAVSHSPDYLAPGNSRICGQVLADPNRARQGIPETVECEHGSVLGRYVTVYFDPSAGFGIDPDGVGGVITICNFAVMGSSAQPTGFRGAGLASRAFVGADQNGEHGLFGSIAMVQIYDRPLDLSVRSCVHTSGRQLVTSGRMAVGSDEGCHDLISTGCTSLAAANGLVESNVDDGSCDFAQEQTPYEVGTVSPVTDSWQQIAVHGNYKTPLVFISLLSRQSTTEAVIRLRRVQRDMAGKWSFEIRAESLSSCHFAGPPALSEQADFLVVEAGLLGTSGTQAGLTKVHDPDWHRVSFLEARSTIHTEIPVVISQLQSYEGRIQFATTRQHFSPSILARSVGSQFYHAFFVAVEGEGLWCEDGEYFAEYFSNIDVSGSPVATECEPAAPNWQWHSCCNGIPPSLQDEPDVSSPELFSVRWKARLLISNVDEVVTFSSRASAGARITYDEITVADGWNSAGTLESEPVAAGAEGSVHYLTYEVRSANSRNDEPTNSYAELSWAVQGSTEFGSNRTLNGNDEPLHMMVGWLSCHNGSGWLDGKEYRAGYLDALQDLVLTLEFRDGFSATGSVFGSFMSTVANSNAGHLRAIDSDSAGATIAIEYSSCEPTIERGNALVGWFTLQSLPGAALSVIHQQRTHPGDIEALLSLGAELGLPEYMGWQNGSDPCRDRWSGIECRADKGEAPRVVVLDIVSRICRVAALFLACSVAQTRSNPLPLSIL
eukprot:SAG22_NODE_89_length_21278_cov_16.698758_12_plen_1385_part_00